MSATLIRFLERLASRQRLMGEVLLLPRTASPSHPLEGIAVETEPATGYRLRRT
jgi:hypothetical protein